jgi:hypothetical protein
MSALAWEGSGKISRFVPLAARDDKARTKAHTHINNRAFFLRGIKRGLHYTLQSATSMLESSNSE